MQNKEEIRLKIALIKPPQETNEVQPPLGLGYIASSVKNIAEVKIIDAIRDNLTIAQLISLIRKSSFDIIGLQCYTVDFNTVKIITKSIRKISPKSIIVVGGPHPTLAPQDTLNSLEVDYAFLGDSEISFQMFVEAIKKNKLNRKTLKKIPGIAYREGKLIKTNAIKYPENLDDYLPSWELYDIKRYPLAPHGGFCKQSPTAPIIITRGCPFNCDYCGGYKISGRRIRSHSVDFVINQIEILVRKYGIREIHIEDDNFTMKREFVEEFCEKLIQKDFGITWTCPNGVRLDTLDRPLLMLMKKSGLYSLSVGIESGSDRIRKIMRKNLNTQTIEEKVNLIKSCGIDIIGFFIVGYPEETIDEIKQTIAFACRLPLKRATFSAFKPFPGTDAYERLLNRGEIKELDMSKFSLDAIAWSPKGISQEQLKRLRRKAFLDFYLRPSILLKMLFEIKSPENLKFVLIRAYRWLLK